MGEWIYYAVNLIVGAVAGYIFSVPVPAYIARKRAARLMMLSRRYEGLQASGAVHRWLIKYYQKQNAMDDLHDCKIGATVKKIPFLTCPEWQVAAPFDAFSELLSIDLRRFEFPVDESLIKRKLTLGHRLFDEPTLFLTGISSGPHGPVVSVAECSYFSMISRLGGLEAETLKAALRNRPGSTPIRDLCLSNRKVAMAVRMKPFSVGVVALICAPIRGRWHFLVQSRSQQTATNRGQKSGVPSFGLSPKPSDKIGREVMLYNLLKEYLEELFDCERLIQHYAERNIDSTWFYKMPPAREFQAALESGQLKAMFLGFGVDALNGTATLSILVTLDALEGLPSLSSISGNWEAATYSAATPHPLEWIAADSPELERLHQENRLHVGSAFSISLALRHLGGAVARVRSC